MGRKLTRQRAMTVVEKQYICFFDTDIDLSWPISHVERFKEMWIGGDSLVTIAKALKRHPVEVTLLILDLAEAEQIEKRPTGIYGQ